MKLENIFKIIKMIDYLSSVRDNGKPLGYYQEKFLEGNRLAIQELEDFAKSALYTDPEMRYVSMVIDKIDENNNNGILHP